VNKRYGLTGFPESIKIAEYIKLHTNPEDRIQVFGSEPQIYFYSDRKSASKYVYMYQLTEKQKYNSIMKEEFYNDINRVNPKIIVFYPFIWSWGAGDLSIIDWADRFLKQNYYLIGIADLVSNNDIRIKWLEELKLYKRQSDNIIFILERK
jgi:hypothetical protein